MKLQWVAVALLLSWAGAQEVHVNPRNPIQNPVSSDSALYHVKVDLALIPVTVTDPQGHPFVGLRKDHFQVFYDGKPQTIRYFSQEDAPISLGIVLDRSGSMGLKWEEEKAALQAFAQQANPADEMFLLTFADTIEASEFSSVGEDLNLRTLLMQSKGRTSLLDAIYFATTKMRTAKYQRRALVLITDGGDNHSRYSAHEVGNLLEESDVQLFTLALLDTQCLQLPPNWVSGVCAPELYEAPSLLEELTRKAGGIGYALEDSRDLSQAIAHIGYLLREQYVLGFNPKEKVKADCRFHKLRVQLHRLPKKIPRLQVEAREGFYAPAD